MFDFGHCRHVRCTAQASFVGEYAPFDPHHDGAANEAAKGLVQSKRTFEDGQKHHRHMIELQDNDV
ncbi:hypothetical protein D3C80_1538400 [compost metagenome]